MLPYFIWIDKAGRLYTMDSNEAKNEMLKALIGSYGEVETWTTQHFDHLMVLMDLLGMEATGRLAPEFESLKQSMDFLIDKQTKKLKMLEAVQASNMSIHDKDEVIDYISSQEPFLTDEQLDIYVQSLRTKKGVGRPKKYNSIHEWIIYLTGKLGSNRKACIYVADHPVLKPQSPETLIRTNRQYRADKDKRLY